MIRHIQWSNGELEIFYKDGTTLIIPMPDPGPTITLGRYVDNERKDVTYPVSPF